LVECVASQFQKMAEGALGALGIRLVSHFPLS
jgi:hypothetical protein